MQPIYHWFLMTYVCDDSYNSWINNTHVPRYIRADKPYLTQKGILDNQPTGHKPLSASYLGEMTENEFNEG